MILPFHSSTKFHCLFEKRNFLSVHCTVLVNTPIVQSLAETPSARERHKAGCQAMRVSVQDQVYHYRTAAVRMYHRESCSWKSCPPSSPCTLLPPSSPSLSLAWYGDSISVHHPACSGQPTVVSYHDNLPPLRWLSSQLGPNLTCSPK